MNSEVFSKDRMRRCTEIQRRIMDAWQATNSLRYVVRATEPVVGLELSDLRNQYFAVGTEGNVTEIPFHDMLVVFSLIEQEAAALKARDRTPGETEFKVSFRISTSFTDEEAARMLSWIRIESPHDGGGFLRVEAVDIPRESPEDDQSL